MLSTTLGTIAALGLTRLPPAMRAVLGALILSPLIVPGIVIAIGIYYVFARYRLVGTPAGLINTPLRLLNTAIAVHVAMIHILLPYMILPIASVLRQIDGALLRAAAGLGAPPWRVFLQVVRPLSIPGVAAGALLVFVLSLGFYITPALVGGPLDLMLSMLIAQQVDLLNWPYAACLSAALLATTLLLILLFQRLPGVRDALRTAAR